MDCLSIPCIVSAVTAISFHCTGAICLLKINRNFAENIEIYSLSLSSVIFYGVSIAHIVISTRYPALLKVHFEIDDVPRQISSIQDGIFNGLMCPIFGSMIALTVQRFFAIRLHLRYESSWVYLHRTHLIIASWVFGILIFVLMLIVGLTQLVNIQAWKIADIVYKVNGVLTINATFFTVYIYIYIKFKQASQETRSSIYSNRNKAKIFTPFIICGSFFIFGTLSYVIASITTDVRHLYIGIYLDGITNSIVYIFLNERVVNRIQRWKNGIVNNNSSPTGLELQVRDVRPFPQVNEVESV